MNKKGFTLIELLAVIVILAIIALIAVPVVIHIINDSKNSSEKESINLYTDAVKKEITRKQLSNPNFQPDKCTITTDGNLECFKGEQSLGIVEINMKGDMPNNGTIIIENNNIKYENIVLNGKTYYKKEVSTFAIGDKITYKGADWYVISDSPSNQDYVTLMKENVLTNAELGAYAYGMGYNTAIFDDSSNEYETSNVKEALEFYMSNQGMTSDLVYVDEYAIRLLRYEELFDNLGYTLEDKLMPWGDVSKVVSYEQAEAFVKQNFGENQNEVNSFWILPKENDNSCWDISSGGGLNPLGCAANKGRGVCPVINLLKSAIPVQS